jgi:hypothetical protein
VCWRGPTLSQLPSMACITMSGTASGDFQLAPWQEGH